MTESIPAHTPLPGPYRGPKDDEYPVGPDAATPDDGTDNQ